MVMFLVTSIAMLRERTSGTLERLLTTPLARLDLLLGYGLAFGLAAALQAVVTVTVATTVYDLDVAGSVWLVVLIAVADAVLGVALGLLASAFARTEFQAVQFMPVIVLPQFFLCGLLVPRDQMAGWLQAISYVLPLTYAVEALQEVGRSATATATCGGTSPSSPAPPCSPSRSRRRPCGGGPAEHPRAGSTVRTASREPRHPGGRPGRCPRGVRRARLRRRHDPRDRDRGRGRPGARAPLLRQQGQALPGRGRRAGGPGGSAPRGARGRPRTTWARTSSACCCASGTAPARPAALALLRSAVSNEWTAKLLREFLVSQVLRRVVGTLDIRSASGRSAARWPPRSSSAWSWPATC